MRKNWRIGTIVIAILLVFSVKVQATAWDISTATFEQSISSQDTYPTGICFNSDGTKMYEIGSDYDKIYEYTLTTAWDISTATFEQSISSQDSYPTGICFNSDGTKMYEIGCTNDKIYEYTLTTAWDISTATYSQYISTHDSTSMGLCFSTDGTKMYEIGSYNDRIYEYTLTTAWDISTATFEQFISSQDSYPTGICFNSDGTKMYEIGCTNDKIYEYTLTTAWDISTATFEQSISSQDSTPMDLCFNPDGTKMYEIGSVDDKIYEYTLPDNLAPNTPTLNSPADGSTISDITPDLQVNVSDPDEDNITAYDIIVDNNSDFSSPEINLTNQSCNVASGGILTHTCSELTAGQTYYWKIRVSDGTDWSNWTDGTWDFTIKYEFQSVTIETNKSSYYPTEQVEITVTVKDKDGNLLSGCTITGDISKGTTTHNLIFSDNGDGTYTSYYTIPTSDENGEWSVEATVSYTAYVDKSANTSYTLSRLPLNVILTTDYDSYMPGDTINIEVTVKDPYNGLILTNPTLNVIVDEKNGTTHNVSMTDTNADGTFEGSWIISESYYDQIAAMLYQETTWEVKATAQDPDNKASEKTETKDITVEIRTLDVTTEYNRTNYNPGDEVECFITVKDSVTDEGVASATIEWDTDFNNGSLVTNEDGQAILTFNIPANRKTNFTLEITAHKSLYNSKTIEDIISICLLDISVTYDKAQYGKGDVAEITVVIQDSDGNYKSNADLDVEITKPSGTKDKATYARLGNGKYRINYTIPDKEGTYKTQILVTTEDDLRGSHTSEFIVSSLNMNVSTLDPITEDIKSKFIANGLMKIKVVIKDSENTLLSGCDVEFAIYKNDGTEISTGSLFEESSGVYKATTTLPSQGGEYTVKINAQSQSGTYGTASSTITVESLASGSGEAGGVPVEGSSIIVVLAMIGGILFVIILILLKLR